MTPIVRLAIGMKRVSSPLILALLMLYTILVLFPSYWSGLYRLSAEEIQQGHVSVPFYAGSGSVSEAAFPLVPIFISISAWYLIPFLSLLLLIALVIARHTFSRTEKIFWIGSVMILWTALYLTYPAAYALLTWIVD